jgi:Carboxypeptidase regulatory-like domain
MKKTICSLLLTFVLASVAPAQEASGKISGTVLDPSGSGVPDAKITVTNTDRNQVVRTVNTDTSGIYAAPVLPVGNYALRVEAKGFKAENRTGIVLNVNDELKININLQVGATSDTVEVTAQTTQVELGTPASSTTIEGTQVRELALNTRNYEQLVALMPGVAIKANPTDELFIGNSVPSGTSAQIPFSVNGNRNSANNWTVDGADNVDRGANLTLMTYPSIDSIAEFKVERAMYTADTGRAGGAQVNVVTKSGTSAFHGSLYEFFRNDVLTANNFANNANNVNLVNGKAKVPPLRWNDFGGTVGGPVYMGRWNRDKNKTFFFFSEEARRILTYTTYNPALPTASMLQGNFNQPVCIALVNGTCPTAPVTQIPSALFNPVSVQYIKDVYGKLPLPIANISDYSFAGKNVFDSRQEIVRMDQAFSEKFTLWGKFENDSIPTVEPGGLFTGSAIPNGATTNTNSPGQNLVIHAVNIFRPTLVNEIGFDYSHSAINSTPIGVTAKTNSPDIAPPEPFANTQGVVPTISISGLSGVGGYGPYNERNRNWAGFDSLSWVKGRHTLKFGVTIDRYNKSENYANNQGSFVFSNAGIPAGTSAYNQAWANFLLGNVSSFSMPSIDVTPDLWQWQTEAYVQDDFKISPRLTLYAGVRWSYFGSPTESHGWLNNFDPALYNPANAPQVNPANGNLVLGTGNNFATNGIIVGGKNSPFGDKVTNEKYKNFAPRLGLAWDPFGNGRTSIRLGYGLFYDSVELGTYEGNIANNAPLVQSVSFSNALFSNITGGTAGVSASTLLVKATQIPGLIPYSQQWNVDLQRQLAKGIILDVAYVGSKGTHLMGVVDLNQVAPGVALAAGLHQPNGDTRFTGTDDPRINAIRPYLGFNAVNAEEMAFDSNYHSLQTHVRKNFGTVGLLDVAYTWSKNLTDSGADSTAPQSSFNWHEGEYGPSPLDRQQVLAINYIYTIPAFSHSHGVLNRALGGWEITGIPSAYSGTPFTVTTSSVDPAGLGLIGNSASSSRPDMVCDPRANQPGQFTTSLGVGKPTWFNTACFQPVPNGAVRPGNAGRGVVRGPGYFNIDASVAKNFGLSKEDRVKLQIRGEAFNILNWVNPGAFASVNITSTSFGEINSFRAARRIQIAAKLTF